ncbi:MAG: succinate dehydrogenase cytochrome b subunit [Terriglobia bacterium]
MSMGLIISSSIGKKYLMAISGVLLFLFVIVHMLGNLQIFLGPEPLNAYGAFLKSKPGLLWTFRLGLLVLAIIHITTAIQVSLESRRARDVRYATRKPPYTNLASRTLLLSGLILLAFLIYHLMQFTLGLTNPEYLRLEDAKGRHDVYRMAIAGFSQPSISLFYIVSMGLLCLHLSHGVSSSFQSLGLKNKRTTMAIDRASQITALIIFLGNSSMPLAVWLGWIR